MKKISLLFFFIISFCTLFAQEREVQGLVFDLDTKQRLSRVYLYNLRTHKGFYNNTKGEFSTRVSKGDTLIAALPGYRVDTLTVQNQNTLLFYLKRTSIQLREVVVTDTVGSPAARLERVKREYKDIYRKGSTEDILQIGGGNGTGGAGLGIDALWSLLSREGKNARNLQKIIEQDYREMIISYRYSKSFVAQITGLSGDKLTDFMSQYRPSYYFVLDANDYAFIDFVQKAYEQYKRNPAANRLPPLKPSDR
ncbi:carboxypeptidase-like regulatory domain-containing protein [Pedobacter sp. SYSU D00535]|uniref:carboxypeptidase-like regulatory domain-containing protein n=1 Tax=Pedobacter sp. SYSU D00535 TaxID=2810308 RepID=UPI001A97CE80|nr:carboxypeptidase-like regulatory domain-containing protein [Pedobacter sp. SYSU D00535]